RPWIRMLIDESTATSSPGSDGGDSPPSPAPGRAKRLGMRQNLVFRSLDAHFLKILYYPDSRSYQMAQSMTTSAGESGILTIREVADYLKVTDRTIYRLAAAKKIPAFKVGGTWRFSLADIDIWIKQQSMEGLGTGRDEGGAAKGKSNDGERK
ncbi:MAG: helix-turn-helix domain-containing protein, partial [Pirellulales bacterium]